MKVLRLWLGGLAGVRIAARIGASQIGRTARSFRRFGRSAPMTDSSLPSLVLVTARSSLTSVPLQSQPAGGSS